MKAIVIALVLACDTPCSARSLLIVVPVGKPIVESLPEGKGPVILAKAEQAV